MPGKETIIMPIQPYILLQSNHYERLLHPHFGISHFYQFSLSDETLPLLNAVPDGSIDLLFNIGTNSVKTYISGTVFQVKQWELGDAHTCFGVRFQPGQGILPSAISRTMLVNQDLLIDGNLFGCGLEEQLADAGNQLLQRVAIFQTAYAKLLRKHQAQQTPSENIEHYLRQRIYETQGSITMQQLTEETGYSPCYIRRIFKSYHGVSPKQFAQFIRFQHVLSKLHTSTEKPEHIAFDCGYYDEAHMMKEFKRNTGVTLEQYKKMITTASFAHPGTIPLLANKA